MADQTKGLITTSRAKVLIVEDDLEDAKYLEKSLDGSKYECTITTSAEEFLKAIKQKNFNVILVDASIVKEAKSASPESEIIAITGFKSPEKAVEALNAGASDFIEKNTDTKLVQAKLVHWLEKQQLLTENKELRQLLDKKYGFEGIIGESEKMHKVFGTLQQIAKTDATVLIYGESGTGKELVAKSIHLNSSRKEKHFVPLNCAALSESILESELFGHEKGAFTGATGQRKGRFEYASGGTLFLDEIGDIPLPTQVKLLRAIEYGEIFRVGSNEPVKVDVRLVAATNRNLEELVSEGKFREDLYFRLKVVTINLPPLRERKSDIPILAETFMKELSQTHGKKIKSITSEVINIFNSYYWPGNIRELRNCIESMVVVSDDDILGTDDLPDNIQKQKLLEAKLRPALSIDQAEEKLIKEALTKSNGNRKKAATLVGMPERTFYRKLKQYNIS